MEFDPDGLLDGVLPQPVIVQVQPVIEQSVRGLCRKPYDRHPKGCPNFNKCDRCPPIVPMFDRVYDISKPVYAVVNSFGLGRHVIKMRAKNPKWSYAQLSCVLYWQNTARKQLRHLIDSTLPTLSGYTATWCPEGMGVDVTATLAAVGIHLEWPAVRIARQVAFLGVPLYGDGR